MPVDHKRINGPEDAVPYQLFTKLNTKTLNQQFKELINLNGCRTDSRKLDEHRKIFLKTGVVSQAKGSAYIELNETKAIVSVFDPREIPNKNEYSLNGEIFCEFKFATFSCAKRRLHQQDAEEKQNSAIMKQALEATVCRHEFPNFQVDIYALVLHNDGSALSAAITAAGLALSHAGIPMYDVITSVTMGIQGDTQLIDPTFKEESLCTTLISSKEDLKKSSNHGVVVMSYLNTHEQISQFFQMGNLSVGDLDNCVESLVKACKDIVPLIQKCLVKHVIRSVKSNVED